MPPAFGSTVWTFSWNPPYEDAVRRVASSGCTAFELIAWNVDTLNSYYTAERIRSFRSMADGEGLVLTNFFFSLAFRPQPGAATSAPDLAGFRRAIEVAHALGAPVLTSTTPYPFGRPLRPLMQRPTAQEWTAPVEPQWNWAAEYDLVVDAFAQACAAADEAGLKVAIEPHPYRWVSTAQGMWRLIERTGAANLGINFDPSHMFPSGEMPHFAAHVLKGRIFNTHLSDNEGHTNAHWRPGKGKIDWPALLQALADVGYQGPLTLELEDAPGASHWTHPEPASPELDRELRHAVEYLRGVAAGLTRKSA